MMIWLLLLSTLLVGSVEISKAVVTPTCERETKIISSYTALQEDFHLLLHNNVGGHVADCGYTTSTEFICNIEYQGKNKTLEEYYGFCKRASGKIIKRSMDIGHNLLGGFFTFNITISNIPQCVGLSCDEDTIEQKDLQNKVFADFIQEMEVGDICDPESDTWGQLDLGSDFGVQLASWSGIDLRDCFDRPKKQTDGGSGSDSSEEAGGRRDDSKEEEDGGRKLLRREESRE